MPGYPGKLLTLDLSLTAWGVPVIVKGTVEILDVKVPRDAVSRPTV